MRNPIPYTAHDIRVDDYHAVYNVLHSDHIAGNGPYTEKLERRLCKVAGCEYAVAVNSGTAALHIAYLSCGVGPGKTVLTSPVTFIATDNAALMCGAEVKFWDGDSSWQYLEGHLRVPVTLGGQPFNVEERRQPFASIVDACHGPIWHNKHALATCLSLHPAKHIAAGEGGAVLTNDTEIAQKCRELRDHGRRAPTMQMYRLGFNYRLSDINAALALSQLDRYDWSVKMRRRIAAQYDAAFKDKGETVPHSAQSVRHLYQIMHDERDRIRTDLRERGVGSQVHYEPIVPLQPYYRERFGYKPGQFPNAERYAARTLSIPMFPSLTEQEIEHVINSVLEVT